MTETAICVGCNAFMPINRAEFGVCEACVRKAFPKPEEKIENQLLKALTVFDPETFDDNCMKGFGVVLRVYSEGDDYDITCSIEKATYKG